jgi:hypothetical protein
MTKLKTRMAQLSPAAASAAALADQAVWLLNLMMAKLPGSQMNRSVFDWANH